MGVKKPNWTREGCTAVKAIEPKNSKKKLRSTKTEEYAAKIKKAKRSNPVQSRLKATRLIALKAKVRLVAAVSEPANSSKSHRSIQNHKL